MARTNLDLVVDWVQTLYPGIGNQGISFVVNAVNNIMRSRGVEFEPKNVEAAIKMGYGAYRKYQQSKAKDVLEQKGLKKVKIEPNVKIEKNVPVDSRGWLCRNFGYGCDVDMDIEEKYPDPPPRYTAPRVPIVGLGQTGTMQGAHRYIGSQSNLYPRVKMPRRSTG